MERLQKILSACGVGSRRAVERLIAQGRVKVNGMEARIGQKASLESDTIEVDGVVVTAPPQKTYLMLHKPRGWVTTLSDEMGRRTVGELVEDCGVRVFPVGRLDLNSEGLLLMTDDGAAAQRLTHPKFEVDKEYLAWVTGDINAALPALTAPMILDGVILHPANVKLLQDEGNGVSLLSVIIHEGRNRQIRRMCAQVGLQVIRLKRIAEGEIALGDLESGRWRYLTEPETAYLQSWA